MGTVYCYSRVSSQQQVSKSGLDRQARDIKQWAESANHKVDSRLKLKDAGRSAFRGKNIEGGDLGKFLALAQAGKLAPDPILAIEALDRVSRLPSFDALQKIVFALIEAGVSLYVLQDQKLYSRDSLNESPLALITLAVRIDEAHSYSKKLSGRITAAHEAERAAIAGGKKVKVRNIPHWIDWDGEDYVLNNRAALVERMFVLSERGYGGRRIAHDLNESGWRTQRGTPYDGTLVNFTMTKETVYGAYKQKGQLTEGFYPAVVSREQFEAAKHRRSKVNVHKGGFAGATKTYWVAQGLSTCHHCGRVVGTHSGQDGRGGLLRYLRCQAPGCVPGGWRLEKAEAYLLERLNPKALQMLMAEPIDTAPAEKKQRDAQVELDAAKTRLESVQSKATEAALSPGTPLATVNLLATAMESAQQAVNDASERLREASAARLALVHQTPDTGPFRAPKTPDERRAINERLTQMGLRIVLDVAGQRWGMALGERELTWAIFGPDWWTDFGWIGPVDESEPPIWIPTAKEMLELEYQRRQVESQSP